MVLHEHLLLLGLLNDGWLSYDRGLNDFGELRSLRANLDLAGGNGSYRGDGSCARTRGCFGCPRTIVADSGHVLGVLRHRLLLLLGGDGDRRLRNLRILLLLLLLGMLDLVLNVLLGWFLDRDTLGLLLRLLLHLLVGLRLMNQLGSQLDVWLKGVALRLDMFVDDLMLLGLLVLLSGAMDDLVTRLML